MFTVPVSNNDDGNHAINAQFESEAKTVHEITSHELINSSDIENEGHPLEQMESQCPQSLSQADDTSAQSSYVSLLADMATIEQSDEFAGQPMPDVITDTVDYSTTTFTSQDLTSLQNENMVSYPSMENTNISYNLTNTVGSTQGIQQFVIIQPFLGETSINSQGTFINLPNTADSTLNLDSNKELEDAVANITGTADCSDSNVASSEGGSLADKSYLVCTNSRGEVKEIQVIQGKQNLTENETEIISSTRKPRTKRLKGKHRRSVITERKQSSSHLKKFSLDDLNSAGKSKKEVFEEYLEKCKSRTEVSDLSNIDISAKAIKNESSCMATECGIADASMPDEAITAVTMETSSIEISKSSDIEKWSHLDKLQNSTYVVKVEKGSQESDRDNIVIESPESQVIEDLHKSMQIIQGVRKEEKVSCNKNCPENKIEDFKVMQASNDLDSSKTVKITKKILRCRHKPDTEIRNLRKKSEASRRLKNTKNSKTYPSIGKDKNVPKLKKENIAVKRKRPIAQPKDSCKLPKLDYSNDSEEQIQDSKMEDDVESRMQEDFCRLFRSNEKCVLRLEPITLKLINPNQVLMIEMDIEKEFIVSAVEKGATTNGLTKYCMKLTAPEQVLQTKSDKTNSLEIRKNVQRANKLKCLKHTRMKCKRTVAEKAMKTPLRNIQKRIIGRSLKNNKEHLINEENMQESNEILNAGSENGYGIQVAKSNLENTADVQDDPAENEFEGDDNFEKVEKIIETESIKNGDEIDIHGDKANDVNSRKRKMRNLGEKKNPNQSSSNPKKEEPSQMYTVVKSEDGIPLYGCPICGYSSKYRQNARKHIYEHTAPRNFVCEKCGSGFKSNNSLQKHKIVHQAERPFKCSLCTQTFKCNRVLKQHLQRHLNLKAFVCEYCSKEFVTKGDLTKHTRSHTGATPYSCQHCDKQFSDISALYRHTESHVIPKPFACSLCRRAFSRKNSAISHLLKCHKQEYALCRTDKEKLDMFIIDTKLSHEKLTGSEFITAGSTTGNPSIVNLTTIVDSFTIL